MTNVRPKNRQPNRNIILSFLIRLHVFLFLNLFIHLIIAEFVYAQEYVIKSTVECDPNGDEKLRRPAKYILVVPYNKSEFAKMIDEWGDFELHIPSDEIKSKNGILLVYYGKKDQAEDQYQSEKKFVSYYLDDLKSPPLQITDNVIEKPCEQIEFADPADALELLTLIKDSKEGEVANILSSGGSQGAAGLIAALESSTSLIVVGVIIGPPDSVVVKTVVETLDIRDGNISLKKSTDGLILTRAYSEFSQNIGFNFTPYRNLNEAFLWNASAIMLSPDNQVSFRSDYKRFFIFSGLSKSKKNFRFAWGLYWLDQNKIRTAVLDSIPLTEEFKGDELMAITAIATQPKENLSIGFSAKFIYQNVQTPVGIRRTKTFHDGVLARTNLSFLTEISRTREFDFDLSATYEPFSHFRFGFSLMNVLGTKLHVDADEEQHLRSLGLGITYLRKRLNIGSEINIIEAEKTIFAAGVNYILLRNTTLNIGYSSDNNRLLFGINYRNLFYSFNKSDFRGHYHLTGTRFRF